MKYFFVFILAVFIGCKGKVAHKSADAIKDSTHTSTGFYYTPIISSPVPVWDFNRYFYITYQTTFKNNAQFDYGEIMFYCNCFPSKTSIDSSIFSGLSYKRSCYQNIILTSIYEFKNKQDFNSFTLNYKAGKPKLHKKNCEEEDLFKGGADSSIIIPLNGNISLTGY